MITTAKNQPFQEPDQQNRLFTCILNAMQKSIGIYEADYQHHTFGCGLATDNHPCLVIGSFNEEKQRVYLQIRLNALDCSTKPHVDCLQKLQCRCNDLSHISFDRELQLLNVHACIRVPQVDAMEATFSDTLQNIQEILEDRQLRDLLN